MRDKTIPKRIYMTDCLISKVGAQLKEKQSFSNWVVNACEESLDRKEWLDSLNRGELLQILGDQLDSSQLRELTRHCAHIKKP